MYRLLKACYDQVSRWRLVPCFLQFKGKPCNGHCRVCVPSRAFVRFKGKEVRFVASDVHRRHSCAVFLEGDCPVVEIKPHHDHVADPGRNTRAESYSSSPGSHDAVAKEMVNVLQLPLRRFARRDDADLHAVAGAVDSENALVYAYRAIPTAHTHTHTHTHAQRQRCEQQAQRSLRTELATRRNPDISPPAVFVIARRGAAAVGDVEVLDVFVELGYGTARRGENDVFSGLVTTYGTAQMRR